MRALKIITGYVIYNPAYTYKFQLKTTKHQNDTKTVSVCLYSLIQHKVDKILVNPTSVHYELSVSFLLNYQKVPRYK